jgi:sensor histidine kinase YesM
MDPADNTKTDRNNLFLELMVHSRYRLCRHLVLILFLASVIYNGKTIGAEPVATYAKIAMLAILLSLFYLNMYRLTPKLLLKNRYAEYGLSVLGLVVIALLFVIGGRYFLKPYFRPVHNREDEGFNIFAFIFMFLVLTVASAAVKLFQRWVVDSRRISELEKTTMQSELQQLKNQINPHFLFNMLNNTNVLIKKDPEKASQVLMKLSDLLHYQLYDSARNKVLLTADIHFLTDLLNLEKIRRDNFEFIVSKEGDISGVQVPPLLFIIFVENAVKHNMDAEKPSYVNIYFRVQNSELHFKCINSKPHKAVLKKNAGGLGLANVRRTLELLYPAKHSFTIKDEINTYCVTLTIKL